MQHDFHPCQEESSRNIFHSSQDNKIIFHCYWYGTFGRKQALSIKSLLATQKSYRYEIWLWLDEEAPEANTNGKDNPYINQICEHVNIKSYSPDLAKSVLIFRKIPKAFNQQKYLAARSDSFRIWALYEYGGCYFDLDVMFLRDMGNLFMGSEFVYAWEKQAYANSAIIFMRKGSYTCKYTAKKFALMHRAQPWIIFRYSNRKLHDLKLYPCSLFDPLWYHDGEKYIFHDFEGFFRSNAVISNGTITSPVAIFPYSYCYHWHNLWDAEVEHDSPFEFCEKYFDNILK